MKTRKSIVKNRFARILGVSVKLSVSRSGGVRKSLERVGLITLALGRDCLKIIGKNNGFRDESFLWSHYSG